METFIGFVKADAETSLERAIEYLSSWGPHKNSHGDVRKILIAVAMLEHGYGKDAKLIEADLPWLEAIETLYQQKSAKLGNEEDQKWVDKQSPDTGIPGDSNTLN